MWSLKNVLLLIMIYLILKCIRIKLNTTKKAIMLEMLTHLFERKHGGKIYVFPFSFLKTFFLFKVRQLFVKNKTKKNKLCMSLSNDICCSFIYKDECSIHKYK